MIDKEQERGTSADADRATHEPSPDGLGHSVSVPSADPFETRARELIQERLLSHPDEGVRAIATLCDPPEDAVRRVAEEMRKKATMQ